MGAPLGLDSFCLQFWDKYLDEVERETRIVCDWKDVQGALTLFRLCIASKLTFMLRSMPPRSNYAQSLTTRATDIMKDGMSRILGGNAYQQDSSLMRDDTWWLQASLPPKLGGCGIVDPSLIQPIAFLASEAAASASISA